jgi:hypothetical protein
MKGSFSLDAFDPGIDQQEARQILCCRPQVALLEMGIDG